MYVFWIETEQEQIIEWRRLTKSAAEKMYRETNKAMPYGVKRYGWKEA